MDAPRRSEALLSIDDVATRLDVTPRFVRRLVDERRVPFHKVGKFVRFQPADIDAFIANGRVEPPVHRSR
jgi:excisionase family DNA binding protein